MDRATPVRKLHTNTSDLLVWSENPSADSNGINSATSGSRPTIRPHQPSDKISKVLFGGQLTEEEAETLMKRKPCSGHKLKEITGSGIFTGESENGASEAGISNQPHNKTGLRIYQQTQNGMSQISFSSEESVSPKKPISIAEVAKQRELSGTLESDSDAMMKKQLSDAKCKELSGHDIFGPPPEIPARPLAARNLELKGSIDMGEPAPRNVRTSVKVSNPSGGQSSIVFSEETPVKTAKKIHNQKFQELTGNDIFKGDAPPGSAEKALSSAKLREINGSDIFSDGKAASRDYLGGVRKPPGGESSIALV
ncbi:N-lysine methyltransferase [Thalictrum thalictroides]|uniref:N-lysine methyltransferase n=1 Tax=Thalictrum thalictroides TaxID=46969 RepID=A0A7J6VL04_THATH|nr:N-lysine methyltransferase [Thalictrum thalictroides]